MVFQERCYGVLLVSAGKKFTAEAMNMLPVSEFWPVDTATSIGQARRALTERSYDIVIINAPLPDELGSQLAIDVCNSSNASALLLVKNEIYDIIYSQVTEFGVLTLSKPTSREMIAQSLRTMCATRERLRRLEEKQASVEEKISEMRLVNRAKWQLIGCLGMTEEQAHKYIEKQAMDLRATKREVAESIIKTYDYGGGSNT